MSYLVHLTAPIPGFRTLNFRGETRFEANALEAVVSQGGQVHTTTDVWRSPTKHPHNMLSGLNPSWVDSSTLISYGVPSGISTGYIPEEALNAPYKIIQMLDGPSEENKDNFLKYDRERPGSIVATCSFRAWEYLTRLQNTLGVENVEWVYGPTVPEVYLGHNSFEKTNLLWSYRNFCSYAERDPEGMRRLFNQLAGYLRSHPELTLTVLAQPINDETKVALQGDRHSWFFGMPFTEDLLPFSDRVEVLTDLHWYQVLDLMSKTKLIVSPAEPLGGPAFEAAAYGIPTILEKNTNPFIDKDGTKLFPEVLAAPQGFSTKFFELIDCLFNSPDFYCKHGDAYRLHVKQHATYEAYVNKIEAIAEKRGWK